MQEQSDPGAFWLDTRVPFHTTVGDAGRPAFRPFEIGAVDVGGVRIPVAEDILGTLPFAQLRRLRREGSDRRVLVVAPLAGGFPILMRDLAAGLLGLAGEVHVSDWPDARHVPLSAGRFGLDENCLEVARMIRTLGPQTHVVAVCQGVIPALAASALLAPEGAAPLSLTLLGGPVDPARNPTRLDRMLGAEMPALDRSLMETVPPAFAGAGRRVFPRRRQMQAFGLYLWRQAASRGELPVKLMADDGADPLRFPLARLCWDMMDIPEEFFVENVTKVFQQRALPAGTLEVAGREVRPEALERTALLTGEAAEDDIAAPGQTEAAQSLCPAVPADMRRRLLVPHAGHFSLFYGRPMREEVLPAISHLMAAAEHRFG